MVKSKYVGIEKSNGKDADMSDEKSIKPTTPPYVSYRTFVNFLADMKNGIPNQIDRSAFPSMAGGTYNQLLPALRYIGLVDSTDRPKESLKRLVFAEGDDRQRIYTEILKSAYQFLFVDFDLGSATPKMLDDCFRENGAGGETIRKCIVFFLNAAKDAGIPIGNRISVPVPRTGDRKTTSRQKPKGKHQEGQGHYAGIGGGQMTGGIKNMSVVDAAMSKIPTFDPNWPPETQENYMKYIERVFGLVEKISGDSSNKVEDKPEE